MFALLKSIKPGDALPGRLQLFKLGQNDSNQGPFFVDEKTLAQLAANQRLLGRERVPIGFEHNIDEGSDEYKRTAEPRAIAGMADVEAVPCKGIFLSAIDWNKMGADNIGNYEDISPTPIFDKTSRRVLAIASASLTRTGSVYGLTLENAALAKLSAALLSAGAAIEPQLTGSARVFAAFQLENSRRTRLAAATLAPRVTLDPSLRGSARILAAFEAQNRLEKCNQSR